MNITGGILARIISLAKILMLGNMLPTSDNPVRLDEEIALLDVISGGRIISGFVHGIGIESWANNTNPIHNRERFKECHDLVVKTWTTPGPFRWEGTHYHYRAVNPWLMPVPKPHPPVRAPGTEQFALTTTQLRRIIVPASPAGRFSAPLPAAECRCPFGPLPGGLRYGRCRGSPGGRNRPAYAV